MISLTVKESGYHQTPKDTKVNSKWEIDMEKELITILMEIYTEVIGLADKSTVMES